MSGLIAGDAGGVSGDNDWTIMIFLSEWGEMSFESSQIL